MDVVASPDQEDGHGTATVPNYSDLTDVDIELSQPLESVTITWRCNACGLPIGDGDGYIDIDSLKALEQHGERRAWERDNAGRMVSLAEIPFHPPVPWHAWHQACDPDRSNDNYWFDIERVRNMAQYLDFYGHVSEKNWHGSTNLRDIRSMFGNVYGLC